MTPLLLRRRPDPRHPSVWNRLGDVVLVEREPPRRCGRTWEIHVAEIILGRVRRGTAG